MTPRRLAGTILVAAGVSLGDDGTLLLVGGRMCHMLYTGESSSDAVAALASEYGASVDEADRVLCAARSTLCTRGPGH